MEFNSGFEGLMDVLLFESQLWKVFCLFSTTSNPSLPTTQLLVQWKPRIFFPPRLRKQSGRDMKLSIYILLILRLSVPIAARSKA